MEDKQCKIHVTNLKKNFGKLEVLKDISVDVQEGEVVVLLGPSGSGKSTLLMLLSRIYKIQQGSIELDNKNIWDYKIKEFARKVAVVHQKNQVYGDLNVRTIIGYGRLPYLNYHQSLSKEDKQIIDWAIEVTNLKEHQNKMLNSLSGGQQQRVALARALASKPAIIFADEPTGNLDAKSSKEVVDLLKIAQRKYHETVILVTHDQEIASIADRVITIEDGKIIQDTNHI